jgi:hypothetical protein
MEFDIEAYEKEFGPRCPKCGCHHRDHHLCTHDPTRPCRYCTRPVGWLSTGGPDVCVACEIHGVPPDVFMGHRAPYDFHLQRENPEEYSRQVYGEIKRQMEAMKLKESLGENYDKEILRV